MKTFLTIFLICLSLLITGCPKKEPLIRESAKIVNQATGAIIKVRDAVQTEFEAGSITKDKRDDIIGKTLVLLEANKTVNDSLQLAFKEFPNEIPKSRIAQINLLFNDKVMIPFFALFESVGLLTASAKENILFAVNALKIVLLTISVRFDDALGLNQTIDFERRFNNV